MELISTKNKDGSKYFSCNQISPKSIWREAVSRKFKAEIQHVERHNVKVAKHVFSCVKQKRSHQLFKANMKAVTANIQSSFFPKQDWRYSEASQVEKKSKVFDQIKTKIQKKVAMWWWLSMRGVIVKFIKELTINTQAPSVPNTKNQINCPNNQPFNWDNSVHTVKDWRVTSPDEWP